MRWDNLFDDLESQLADVLASDDVDLRVEEERLRLARLTIVERLDAIRRHRASESVRFALTSGRIQQLQPVTIGRDWISGALTEGGAPRRHGVIPLAAVQSILMTDAQVRSSLDTTPMEESALQRRLGMAHLLRDLCRRRSAVEVALVAGGSIHGTIDRVARDHLDLAVHEPGMPRRSRDVLHVRLVPVASIELIATG